MPKSMEYSIDISEEAKSLRIGEQLSQFRKEKGLTLAQLSTSASISEATLSRAENGLSPLNAHNLYILARVLEVDVVSFFRTDSVSISKGMRSVTRRGAGDKESTARYDLELLCAELSAKKMVPSLNRVTATSLGDVDGLRAHEGEEFLCSLSIDEVVLLGIAESDINWKNPDNKKLSPYLYRVQKISDDITLRHHLVTKLKNDAGEEIGRAIKTPNSFNGIKCYIDRLGKICKAND